MLLENGKRRRELRRGRTKKKPRRQLLILKLRKHLHQKLVKEVKMLTSQTLMLRLWLCQKSSLMNPKWA